MEVAPEYAFETAALSDVGSGRDHNEDYCGVLIDSGNCGVVCVADGVSGSEGGETASRMAIEVTLRVWRELPVDLSPARRLARAVQQANIEVHELSLFVPELRSMATTLIAVAIDRGEMTAVHVGDSRLYLVRGGRSPSSPRIIRWPPSDSGSVYSAKSMRAPTREDRSSPGASAGS